MKRRTIAIVLISLGAILLLGGYYYLPKLALRELGIYLSHFGIKDFTYSDIRLGIARTEIEGLALNYQGNSQAFKIEISNVAMDYRINGIKDLRLVKVTLTEGAIRGSKTIENSKIKSEPLAVQSILERLKMVPNMDLELSNMIVTTTPNQPSILLNARLKRDRTDTGTTGSLAVVLDPWTFITDLSLKDGSSVINVDGKIEKLDKKLTSFAGSVSFLDDNLFQPRVKLKVTDHPLMQYLSAVDLNAELASGNKVLVRKVNAKLLDSEIEIGPSLLSLGDIKWSTPVSISGLSLEKIMELYPQEKIAATGILDIKFVLRSTKEGLRIDDGKVSSRPPGGIINVVGPDLGSGTAAQAAIAFNALKDFRYDRLTADMSYHPDGKLILALHLRGRNPTWQNGRLTEFNINLEDNIPALLKTIRLTQDVMGEL